jgi:hypothetical protein
MLPAPIGGAESPPPPEPLPPVRPGDIATIPAVPVPPELSHRRSPVTGRPARPVVLAVAETLLGLGIALVPVAYGRLWWDAASVSRLAQASRLFGWVDPDPVSWQAVGLVIASGLLSVLIVAALGVIAYNAWQGRLWTRWGGFVALVVAGGAAYLSHPWTLAVVPAAFGATILLWLPPFRAFCRASATGAKPTGRKPVDPTPVAYGSQQLLGN